MMLFPILMLAASSPVPAASAPWSATLGRACPLQLSPDGPDGDRHRMPHAGTALSIHDVGGDRMSAALRTMVWLDHRHRALPVTRTAPAGMHPGPVMPRSDPRAIFAYDDQDDRFGLDDPA